jgi:hypothetical protein
MRPPVIPASLHVTEQGGLIEQPTPVEVTPKSIPSVSVDRGNVVTTKSQEQVLLNISKEDQKTDRQDQWQPTTPYRKKLNKLHEIYSPSLMHEDDKKSQKVVKTTNLVSDVPSAHLASQQAYQEAFHGYVSDSFEEIMADSEGINREIGHDVAVNLPGAEIVKDISYSTTPSKAKSKLSTGRQQKKTKKQESISKLSSSSAPDTTPIPPDFMLRRRANIHETPMVTQVVAQKTNSTHKAKTRLSDLQIHIF